MFLSLNDQIIHADLRGPAQEPVLVLLHSLGTSMHLWDPQVERLAVRHRLLRIDMRGHGSSGVPEAPFALEDLADDVLAVLDHLGIERFAVAGVSIGGMVAQCLAAKAPQRLRGLVFIDTSLVTASPTMWRDRAAEVREHGLAHLVEGILARWVTPAFAAHAGAQALRIMLARTPPAGFAGCAQALAEADFSHPRAHGVPTLVMVGEHDLSTPPAAAALLAEAHGGRLIELEGAAHIPNFEQPESLAAGIEDFLARLAAAPA